MTWDRIPLSDMEARIGVLNGLENRDALIACKGSTPLASSMGV